MDHSKEHLHVLGHMLFFSQVVSSQLCHDFASPIGALITGIDMLPPVAPEDQEIVDLLQSTAQTLKNRLNMFRGAFATGGQTLGAKYTKTLIHEYFSHYDKVELSWDLPDEQFAFPKGTFQLLLNILMWMNTKAPKGGKLRIFMEEDEASSPKIHLQLTSSMIFIRPDDEDILKGKITTEYLQPQTSQTYMIFLLSTVLNYPLELKKISFEELSICIHLNDMENEVKA